ncbi:nuclear transport factor 2 family protein [Mucilaginibacter sp. NFX135]|uniref:nuclear transport factor 2 family protein n=1 Tax=Mucilaginibacter sp. NFX135 TaxID=3402687 RepID=UPI003AFAB496
MKIRIYRFLIAITFLLSCTFLGNNVQAQATQKHIDQKLYNTILHMDSVCFDAYNTRDLETLKKVFSPSLEFYHDLGGLTNYEQNIQAFEKNFANNNNSGLKRELVKGSLEVYPIKDYGAIEVGMHRFTHMENGKEVVGLMKFLHVWQYKNNEWKITRIISYDH